MKRICIVLAALLLLSLCHPVSANGQALVLYKTWSPDDGWVRYSYYTSYYWDEFRDKLEEMGWTADFARHVDSNSINNYDVLFVLTPYEDIPDGERQTIIDWVENGGNMVISQDDGALYSNELTRPFGMTFGADHTFTVNDFNSHAITNGVSMVTSEDGSVIETSGDSNGLGYFDGSEGSECLLAINESAGKGTVVAIGEESMWKDGTIGENDNELLLENILNYYASPTSVPEFTPLTMAFSIIALMGMVLFLIGREK
ncbi:MAG: DUF4350 domain-containing protein [Archaeoglobaceae archaeon]